MHFGLMQRSEPKRRKQHGRVSEALNAVGHAQPTASTCVLSFYCSDKAFGYAPGSAPRQKERNPKRVRCTVGCVKAVSRESSSPLAC